MRWSAMGMFLVLAAGCGTEQVVPLVSSAGVPVTQPTTVPLRVVTRSTAVEDPLHLRGSSVAYGEIEEALGHAVASAAAPWAGAHRGQAGGNDGWQLLVEVINADASYDGDRVLFSLGVRATLRARSGNVYLAQTQVSCRQGGTTAPDRAGPIMYRCMGEIGRDLEGWLEGVDLGAASPTQAPARP